MFEECFEQFPRHSGNKFRPDHFDNHVLLFRSQLHLITNQQRYQQLPLNQHGRHLKKELFFFLIYEEDLTD